jgi:hypothetical protein
VLTRDVKFIDRQIETLRFPQSVSPQLKQVYKHLSWVERQFGQLLRAHWTETLPNFSPTNHSSVLLMWYENTTQYAERRERILNGRIELSVLHAALTPEGLAEEVLGSKQNIFELGCRDGGFLKLCRTFGAKRVGGLTDDRYKNDARKNLGTETLIVEGLATQLDVVKACTIAASKPTEIVSVNLFAEGRRAVFQGVPGHKIVQDCLLRWKDCALPRTTFTVVPSVDGEALVCMRDFSVAHPRPAVVTNLVRSGANPSLADMSDIEERRQPFVPLQFRLRQRS